VQRRHGTHGRRARGVRSEADELHRNAAHLLGEPRSDPGRQNGDVGTQPGSTSTAAQLEAARASLEAFQKQLERAGFGAITTEIREAPPWYYAEEYHQQYLAKNPGGYCGLGGTGVSCPNGSVA
jgi:peptide methionine sulfoxide reductase MsrA